MIVGVFTDLLLSPLPFVLALVAAAVLGSAGRRRAALWTAGATAAVLLVFSTGVVSMALLRPLERRYPAFPDGAPAVDAVVVLGSGVVEGSPAEGGGPALDSTGLARVVAGYMLAERLHVPIVVSGGRTWRDGGTETEAEVAARLLGGLGMPAAMIRTEGKSTTTWENARGVAGLLAGTGMRRVALVTSAWHMPRAMLAFQRAGLACVAAPTASLAAGRGVRVRDVMPGFGSLRDSAIALREYLGILSYSLRR